MKLFSFLTLALCGVFGAAVATASTVVGSIWEDDLTGASDAIPGNVPVTAPNVTFSTKTPINFASGNLYTIGEFLASGNGSTVLSGAGELGNTLNNTLFEFTGTVSVTHGETFTAGHDDGLTLVIGGTTVISAPGPTAFVVTSETYTGPTGNEPFQLVYGECCGPPGDFSISLPLTSPVPLPSTAWLALSGLAGLGIIARRKHTA